MFIVLSSSCLLAVSHYVNPIINNIQRDEIHKTTWIMFWMKMLKRQNDKTKKYRRQFILTAAVWKEHNQNTTPRLTSKCLKDQFSWPFLTFSSVAEKLAVVERLFFASWWHALVGVAVAERFKKESMYGMLAGTKKVVVVQRRPLVWLYHIKFQRIKMAATLSQSNFW